MNRESSSLSPPTMYVGVAPSRRSGSVVEHLLAQEKVAGMEWVVIASLCFPTCSGHFILLVRSVCIRSFELHI